MNSLFAAAESRDEQGRGGIPILCVLDRFTIVLLIVSEQMIM